MNTTPALSIMGQAPLLEQLLDNSGLLVCIKDNDLRLTRISPALSALLAPYCPSPLGRQLAEVLPSAAAAIIEQNDRQALKSGAAMQQEETLDLWGVRRTFLSNRIPLFDAQGRPAGLGTVSTEITPRKRIETALEIAGLGLGGLTGSALHKRLVKEMGETLGVDMAFIATVDGPPPETATMQGFWYRGELLDNVEYPLAGTPCRTVVERGFQFYPERVAPTYPEDDFLMDMDVCAYAGYPLMDSSGNVLGLIVAAHGSPLQDAEATAAVLRIYAIRAAAECERVRAERAAEAKRRVLENRLRQAQKMEALGHLTGGIAHDFNNILTSILGYAVLAGEKAAAIHDPRVLDYLNQIRRSGEHARDLIRQMLTFSRGERGAPQPLLLTRLASDAVRLYRSSFPATVEFRLRSSSEPPPVMADPILLEQALMNLCINARDAMDNAGAITISVDELHTASAECASCRESAQGNWVALSVTDTGPGIPPEIQDRVFEPFFSTKEVGRGSGMGLATVHGVIHEYGGHVLLETAADMGTCLRLLLPASASGAATDRKVQPAGSAETPATEGSGRILVVDDEASVRAFMADLLGSRGYDVSLAASGAEAMEQLTIRPADLVITDQTMPGMTGLALAEMLRRERPELPVLLYSGHPEVLTAERLSNTGIRAVLDKPLEIDRLVEAIRDAMGTGH